MSYFLGMRYPLETMEEYFRKGWAIDARKGGLIWGRSHDEGGIYYWVKKDDFYVLTGEVEGYEYILNDGATHYYSNITARFHQYHKHELEHGNEVFEYNPPSYISILDTVNSVEPKFLLFDNDRFSIINKYSTKGYLNTLDEMNKAVTFEVISHLMVKYEHHQTKDIEVNFYDTFEGYIPGPKQT